jgi:hypothetical protein
VDLERACRSCTHLNGHIIAYAIKKNSIEFVIILVMALFLQTLGAVLHLLVPIRVLYLVSAVAKDPFDQI